MIQVVRFLAALVVVLCWVAEGHAQCTGVFPPNTVCGNALGVGAPPRAITPNPTGTVVTPIQFGASGSGAVQTGTVAGGSSTLTLTGGTSDFANGHGIRVNGAGAAYTVGPVTGTTVTAGDTVPGSTTYQYQVSTFDNNCGVGAAIAPVTLGGRPAALAQSSAFFNARIDNGTVGMAGTTMTVSVVYQGAVSIGQVVSGAGIAPNTVITAGSGTVWTVSVSQLYENPPPIIAAVYIYNQVSWTAPAGTAPAGYAIWGRQAGAMVLLGLTVHTTWYDVGQVAYGNPAPGVTSRPDWVPAAPPAGPLPDCLVTSVTTGGGTPVLTLASMALNAATATGVHHDDTAAFQLALGAAAGAAMYIPTGNYQFHGGLSITAGTRVYGDGWSGDAGNEYFYSTTPIDCSDTRLIGTRLCFDVNVTGVNAVTDSPVSFQNLSVLHPHGALEDTFGIRVAASMGTNSINTQSFVDRVFMAGQYIALAFQDALSVDVTNSEMVALTGGGIDINTPTFSSASFVHIINNRMWGNTIAEGHANQFEFCYQLRAGGDLRIADNKCSGGGPNTSGLLLLGHTATVPPSSQAIEPIQVVNNSIEGPNVGITFVQQDQSVCSNQITIAGNQMWVATYALYIANSVTGTSCGNGTGANAKWVNVMSVTGNSFVVNGFGAAGLPFPALAAVNMNGVGTLSYSGNTHSCAFTSCAPSSAGVVLGANTNRVVVQGGTYDPTLANKVTNLAPPSALNLDYDDGYPGTVVSVSNAMPGTLTFTTNAPQMLGLAGGFTPVVSGKVAFSLSGSLLASGMTPFGCEYGVVYSTGTAPAHGAAVPSGVNSGIPAISKTGSVASLLLGLDGTGIVTGLMLGTPYWFDVFLLPYAYVSGATCTADSITMTAREL